MCIGFDLGVVTIVEQATEILSIDLRSRVLVSEARDDCGQGTLYSEAIDEVLVPGEEIEFADRRTRQLLRREGDDFRSVFGFQDLSLLEALRERRLSGVTNLGPHPRRFHHCEADVRLAGGSDEAVRELADHHLLAAYAGLRGQG